MNRRDRLRIATQHEHATLDRLVAERRTFDSLEGYGTWLRNGMSFHNDMQDLIGRSEAASKLPLESLARRTALIEHDLADLDQSAEHNDRPLANGRLSEHEALGMLYVTEGASLGARVLLVKARGLGLSESYGARHLAYAAHQLGHWHDILAMLESYRCHPDDEQRMIAAARRAFTIAISHWRRP